MDTEWDKLRTSAENATNDGQLDEAAQFWLTALEKSIDFGKYDPRRILTLESLASVYWRLGQYADALPILVKTFELHEDQLGPDHADIGVLANNLAMLYHTLEQFKQAEELYKRALRIRRKVLGTDDPEVAELIKNYANLLVAGNRAMEAEDLKASTVSVKTGIWNRSGHFKAIQIAAPESLLPEEAPAEPEPEPEKRGVSEEELNEESTGISNWLSARKANSAPVDEKPKWVEMMAKGFQAVKEDNTLQAEQFLRKALTASEEFDPTDPRIPDTLEILSEVLWKNGKIADAEPLCERTLRFYEATLEANHLDIGVVSNNLAMLYHALDKFEEAEPLYKRAISIRTTSQGTSHPEVVSVLSNYANFLYVTQRESEAVNLKNYVRSITSGKWNQVGVFKAMQPNQAPDLNSPKVNQYETFSRLKPDLKKVEVSSSTKIQEEADNVARAKPSDEWKIKPAADTTEPSDEWAIKPTDGEPKPLDDWTVKPTTAKTEPSDEWAIQPTTETTEPSDERAIKPTTETTPSDEPTTETTEPSDERAIKPTAATTEPSDQWAIQPTSTTTAAVDEWAIKSDEWVITPEESDSEAASEESSVAARTKTLEEVRAEERAMFNSVGTQSMHDLEPLPEDPRPVLDRLYDVVKKKQDNGN